jgi:8-oxo-dGTP pyrophosphatase MutT (NUDIX family)
MNPPLADPALSQQWRERLAVFDARPLPLQGRRHAAVAVAITEAGHGADLDGLPTHPVWSREVAMLLTRRANHLSVHAGQWAWPGGRVDAGESAEVAALRELGEEVGVIAEPGDILGRLDDYATRSGYVITPVVVWLGAARDARPQPSEVASVHRIPVSELLRGDAPLLEVLPDTEHPALRMPIGSGWIAAPTAAFLYQFRELLLLDRETRVAHFDQPRFAWR